MNSIFAKLTSACYLTLTCAIAVALSGCEWGGAHENTWNDAYSWADFTGTYRFVKAIIVLPDGPGDGDEVYVKKTGSGSGSFTTESTASGKVSPVGVGIIPTSFSVTVAGDSLKDDGAGYLLSPKDEVIGSVSYDNGAWGINKGGLIGASAGDKVNITYSYRVVANDGTQKDSNNTVGISYLNVIQQGNKLTMTGDAGVKYSGEITSTSMSADSYIAAQTVNVSFKVSDGNGRTIVGTFSGNWSGASDKNYGTLSDRQMNGTHSRAGNFVAVAADKSISVKNVEISE